MSKVHAAGYRFRKSASPDAGSKVPGPLSGSPVLAAVRHGVAPRRVAVGSVAVGSIVLARCARFSCARYGWPGNGVPAPAGSGLGARLRLGRSGLNVPVGFVPVRVVPVRFAPVGIALLGCDYVRINLVGFTELLLRRGPHSFGFCLLLASVAAQALCLDFGLLGIGLGTCCFGLAFPRSKLVGLGLFTHLGGPVSVRFNLAFPVEEQHRGNDRNHHYNTDNDPHKLS